MVDGCSSSIGRTLIPSCTATLIQPLKQPIQRMLTVGVSTSAVKTHGHLQHTEWDLLENKIQ